MVVYNPACGESSGSVGAVLEVLQLSARLTASSTAESSPSVSVHLSVHSSGQQAGDGPAARHGREVKTAVLFQTSLLLGLQGEVGTKVT